jgi:hypothetical protein
VTVTEESLKHLGTALSGAITIEITPLDAVVALKTDYVPSTATVETIVSESKEVFVESPLVRLRVSILDPDNESGADCVCFVNLS